MDGCTGKSGWSALSVRPLFDGQPPNCPPTHVDDDFPDKRGDGGVGFRSLTEAIDTTTPGGRLVFHIVGALGPFERDLIRKRTRAGFVAAVACGRKGGRTPVMTEDKLRRAKALGEARSEKPRSMPLLVTALLIGLIPQSDRFRFRYHTPDNLITFMLCPHDHDKEALFVYSPW